MEIGEGDWDIIKTNLLLHGMVHSRQDYTYTLDLKFML
jgi:hypothetical protein